MINPTVFKSHRACINHLFKYYINILVLNRQFCDTFVVLLISFRFVCGINLFRMLIVFSPFSAPLRSCRVHQVWTFSIISLLRKSFDALTNINFTLFYSCVKIKKSNIISNINKCFWYWIFWTLSGLFVSGNQLLSERLGIAC